MTGEEACKVLRHLEKYPTSDYLLDRHLSRITATIRQIFGDQCIADDFFLTFAAPQMSEAERDLLLIKKLEKMEGADVSVH